ncbi:AMP-dependent synthetase/ligase [Halocatena salina]|uniref:Long-chain fatty acid--CoA ligase n=1 Tax=Halocatena salina TaxID=2934340 RepID=A0A8U0A0B0_9EURY|nr:long-chain fatty acid--CoA ligase [Halocatena salina]UPM42515.1 long-chain fatty acid--CoA ligase [Halocatena salina]
MDSTPDWLAAEQEYTDEVIGANTVSQLFAESASRHADRIAQQYKGGIYDRSLCARDIIDTAPSGEYRELTYEEMHSIVMNLAGGFRDIGVDRDDRVAILANTRMEWAHTDLALLAAGAVVTTVYTESSPSQVAYLLDDPDAKGVIVENEQLLERVLDMEAELDLEFIVVMDTITGYDDRDDILTLGELYERGVENGVEGDYEAWIIGRKPDDLASLIYTSGTTSKPKGVKLTHRNFRANINQIRKRLGPRSDRDDDASTLGPETTALSFLPLAHVFERTTGHFLIFAVGGTVAYAESPDTVTEDLSLVEPTSLTSVPRVYERVYDTMREEVRGSTVKERMFDWAIDIAQEYTQAADPGKRLRMKRKLADKMVYSDVKEQLGGNLELLISGGGSLSTDLCQMFLGMGLTIIEGYGLTETAPVVSVNRPEDIQPGTLGPPLAGIDVALDEGVVGPDQREKATGDIGELLVQGSNVTSGYWNNEEATEDAFTTIDESESDDEWFRTGDIVEQTATGSLIYHDRLKQLLVLDTGKNVAPGPIEESFATSDRIEQVMVLGDDQKFISALVVPNFEAITRWAEKNDVDLPDDQEAITTDDQVRGWVGEEIERVNESFAKHERIKEFELVPLEWTPENDMLTSSMKLKRRNITERFDDRIQRIYGDTDD